MAIKGGSGRPAYKRDCAYCLLQGTPNEPPSPAPRKAAITGKPVSQPRRWLFGFPGRFPGAFAVSSSTAFQHTRCHSRRAGNPVCV